VVSAGFLGPWLHAGPRRPGFDSPGAGQVTGRYLDSGRTGRPRAAARGAHVAADDAEDPAVPRDEPYGRAHGHQRWEPPATMYLSGTHMADSAAARRIARRRPSGGPSSLGRLPGSRRRLRAGAQRSLRTSVTAAPQAAELGGLVGPRTDHNLLSMWSPAPALRAGFYPIARGIGRRLPCPACRWQTIRRRASVRRRWCGIGC